MKIKEPVNKNYCATVIKIKTLTPLENCDNVQGAIIFGNQVIVSNDVKIGDIGLYFPLETQLSDEYCKSNNLYRHSEKNVNSDKKGYMEDNRRIRAMRFRGHKSEGLFMPLNSLNFVFTDLGLKIGDEFDKLGEIPICNKYIVKYSKTPGSPNSKKAKKPIVSKIIDNQFRFHDDTNMLYKNLHKINPESLISITYKLHGTSGISSKLLCKKKLNLWDKIGQCLGFNIVNTKYDYIYSSRKVIKNEELNPKVSHYYNEDIWGLANKQLKDFLQNGMTVYYEIVGYLPGGGAIQKGLGKAFDYGQEENTYGIYIYRITQTNSEGKVFEFTSRQVQNWSRKNGLNPVPELFYGKAKEFSDERLSEDNWNVKFLETIKEKYNEKDCYMCKNKLPEEGCVIRVEGLEFDAYKQKSNAFYMLETKNLDKGEIDIEEEN